MGIKRVDRRRMEELREEAGVDERVEWMKGWSG